MQSSTTRSKATSVRVRSARSSPGTRAHAVLTAISIFSGPSLCAWASVRSRSSACRSVSCRASSDDDTYRCSAPRSCSRAVSENTGPATCTCAVMGPLHSRVRTGGTIYAEPALRATVLSHLSAAAYCARAPCFTTRPHPVADTLVLNSALAGRYRVEREIGRGGMAVVYLAHDVRHNRQVALKLLLPELAQAVGPARFLREIEIAAQLTHPHIVPLFDSGEVEGRLFYVMPFLDGESLRQRLQRERQLAVHDAIAIARQVASALEYAHARNVVHRDIKPENILLYQNEAMVADFGIALAMSAAQSPRITGTGLVVGTPEYMSPEQALDEGADARSDQYSLACVLFEMLAGEAPYTGSTPYSILSKRLMDPVPSVRRLRSTVPPAVDRAIVRALAKTPADRFPTVGAFAGELALGVATPATGTTAAAQRPRVAAVAVLPFRNLSADPENEYFADGITEDVSPHLSKLRP